MNDRNKDMTGVIFKNDRKEKTNHPDRKGQCLIDGKAFWIAGWLKDGKDGQYLSLAFTPKDEAKPKTGKGFRGEDEPIPF